MKVLKSDLYNFVENKVTSEVDRLVKEREALLDTYIRNPIKEMYEVLFKPLNEKIDKLHDDFDKFISQDEHGRKWTFQRYLSDLNGMKNVARNLAYYTYDPIIRYIEQHQVLLECTIMPMSDIDVVKEKYMPIQKKIDDLRTLESELNTVIKSSRSGKQAYDTFISLGVNMDDFVAENKMLPAVQKLSVDTCLINGGC